MRSFSESSTGYAIRTVLSVVEFTARWTYLIAAPDTRTATTPSGVPITPTAQHKWRCAMVFPRHRPDFTVRITRLPTTCNVAEGQHSPLYAINTDPGGSRDSGRHRRQQFQGTGPLR